MSQIALNLKSKESIDTLRRFSKELNIYYTPFSLIWLRLSRFSEGDIKDYSSKSAILLLFRFRATLERFSRFAKGDNKHNVPMYPIKL